MASEKGLLSSTMADVPLRRVARHEKNEQYLKISFEYPVTGASVPIVKRTK
jgi:hypothetical protein